MLRGRLLSCAPVIAGLALAAPAAAAEPIALLRQAMRLPCEAAAGADLRTLAAALPLAGTTTVSVQFSRVGIVGRRLVLDIDGDQLMVQFSGPVGRPEQVAVRYAAEGGSRPLITAIGDRSCRIHTARRLTYDAAGRPQWLEDLDGQLRARGARLPLNPPVPPGSDPPGVAVAVIDTGVNYLLPEIAVRLARDPQGRIQGFDYRDVDRRPFDSEPAPDPFFPSGHGTRIASLVLEGAPRAKLLPYRYPRGAMERMALLIDDAAAQGARIANVSLVSRLRAEWRAFEDAAARHPEILFVIAAGNWGRDIEEQPVYPAALGLDNAIVVTSAGADGRLTPGVNWGRRSVDLMVPAENVMALHVDGERRPVSGSSYAAARISGFAACLLADHPDWSTAGLKAAILAAADPGRGRDRTAHGFISDAILANPGACRNQRPIRLAHGL